MNAFKQNRLGRIFLSAPLIEECSSSELGLLFSHFVPVLAEYNWRTERYEYAGYSEKFESLPDDRGIEIPIYKAIFSSEQDLISSNRIVRLLEFRRS